MKFEDLQYDFSPKPPIDEKNWNRDQWVKDYPVDYFKILYFINQANEEFIQNEVFKTIYENDIPERLCNRIKATID